MASASIIRRIQNFLASLVWNVWVENMQSNRQLVAGLAKILCRIAKNSSARAFQTWFQSVESIRRTRSSQMRILCRMQSRTISCSLQAWKDAALTQQKYKRSARKIVQHMRSALSACALRSWGCHAAAQRRLKISSCRAAGRIRDAGRVKAWSRWRQHAEDTAQARAASASVARRVRYFSAAVAWEGWVEGAKCYRRQVAGLAKMLCQGAHQSSIRAFDCWRRRQRTAAVVRQLRLDAAALAWSRWRSCMPKASSGIEIVVSLCSNWMVAFAAQSPCRLRWTCSASRSTRRNRGIVPLRAGNGARIVLVAGSFNAWRSAVRRTKSARRIALLAARRLGLARCRRPFLAWSRHLLHAAHAQQLAACRTRATAAWLRSSVGALDATGHLITWAVRQTRTLDRRAAHRAARPAMHGPWGRVAAGALDAELRVSRPRFASFRRFLVTRSACLGRL